MNHPDRTEAFRAQALSDLLLYVELLALRVPDCHRLHYLQMATEKAGRAIRAAAGQSGAEGYSHVALVKALRLLRNQARAADVLNDGDRRRHERVIDRCLPLAHAIERLAPALTGDAPNPEYPWADQASPGCWIAPCEYQFELARRITQPEGLEFVGLLRRVLERFQQVFKA